MMENSSHCVGVEMDSSAGGGVRIWKEQPGCGGGRGEGM